MNEPTNNIVLQKFKKKEEDEFGVAQRYYTILSAINNLHLTEREIQLIAFTAVKGNISYSNNKEEFCKLFKSSAATINNLISKLKKIGVLIKEGSKIKVNPVISLPFDKEMVILEIKLHKNV